MKSIHHLRQGQAPVVRSAVIRWSPSLVFYISGCLMHLQFSLWLVREHDTVLGRLSFAQAVPAVVIASAGALLLWLFWRIPRSPRPRLTVGFWLLWLAAVAGIDRYLTYSINEYAHYPQYAMLAWLLARAMDPQRNRWYFGRVLFWATLLGMGDELLQYLWITASYSDYLDFNDFVTNLVAAAGGLLLYYGSSGRAPESARRRQPVIESVVAVGLAFVIAAAFFAGRVVHTPSSPVPPGGIVLMPDGGARLSLQRRPDFYGGWQPSKRHDRYHVLAPLSGLLVMLAAGLLFSLFGSTGGPGPFSLSGSRRSLSSAALPPA